MGRSAPKCFNPRDRDASAHAAAIDVSTLAIVNHDRDLRSAFCPVECRPGSTLAIVNRDREAANANDGNDATRWFQPS
jgi:hypothetical protein